MKVDNLEVKKSVTREEMGKVAASDVVKAIKEVIAKKGEVNMIFAAAPSQNDVLKELIASDVDWSKVNAFHMDEYLGLPKTAPQRFGNFLCEHIFNHLPFKSVNLIDSSNPSAEAECKRYSDLLNANPVDIVVLGIGENGHIAFNEPGSSLSSRTRVKTLTTDTIIANSRFFDNDVNKVPKTALTVGVGTVLSAKEVLILCNGHNKARALQAAVEGSVTQMWTISALQMHEHGIIVCDEAATVELKVGTYNYFKDIEKDNL